MQLWLVKTDGAFSDPEKPYYGWQGSDFIAGVIAAESAEEAGVIWKRESERDPYHHLVLEMGVAPIDPPPITEFTVEPLTVPEQAGPLLVTWGDY